MSEVQTILSGNPPESDAVKQFLNLNYQPITSNAIYAAVSGGNIDCIKDSLKAQVVLEGPNDLNYRINNLKNSVSELLIDHGESEISELPEELQSLVAVIGYSLGRCDSIEADDVSVLFKKLEYGHAKAIEDNLNNSNALRANGELAPELSIPSKMQ